MAWATVLVRYGEIGIKSRVVRSRLERQLVDHLEHALASRGVEATLKREWGRILILTAEPPLALNAARHTFGVVSASAAREFPADVDAILKGAREAGPRLISPGQTFGVRGRRTGDHPFKSGEIAGMVGAAIQDAVFDATGTRPKVDLDNPDVEVFIEVRQNHAYLFTNIVKGPGGLPVGSQGKSVIILDEPAAAVAAWLTMRRGVKPLFIAPRDRMTQLEPALRALARWLPRLPVMVADVPEELEPTGRRAYLLDCASDLARGKNAACVVLADQVAGATAYAHLDARARVTVFRPLVGYTGPRFQQLASEIEIPVDEPAAPTTLEAEPMGDARLGRLPRSAEVWEVVM